ncbi:hypothetical protein [Kordiimonas gwangyangensis]|uniref:hypothetical protein n=1 Tax=Kordiimonas gwangyangensis TaxID=288022 RepID=UPI000684DC45|nr:hypothetical protein [Kordiimonas gwangyangensis]
MLARGYEWSVAMRYMLARKRDRVISVTAVLSVTAIALGVTALIVVMAVMNGFRAELMDKILGYHGHILIQATAASSPATRKSWMISKTGMTSSR